MFEKLIKFLLSFASASAIAASMPEVQAKVVAPEIPIDIPTAEKAGEFFNPTLTPAYSAVSDAPIIPAPNFKELDDFISHTPDAQRILSNEDFIGAAIRLGLTDARAIKAVDQVEAAGSGYDAKDRPKILFEPHVFNKRTKGKYLGTKFKGDPSKVIASASWNKANYPRNSDGVYAMLFQAMQLDLQQALCSASWGRYQIMGYHYALCGFKTVEEFVMAMIANEDKHLDAFVSFVVANRLDDELRRLDFAGFAYGYNGAGYAKNAYDVKMKSAFDKLAPLPVAVVNDGRKYPSVGPAYNGGIKRVQEWLNSNLRPSPNLKADGLYGSRTKLALDIAFKQLGVVRTNQALLLEKVIA